MKKYVFLMGLVIFFKANVVLAIPTMQVNKLLAEALKHEAFNQIISSSVTPVADASEVTLKLKRVSRDTGPCENMSRSGSTVELEITVKKSSGDDVVSKHYFTTPVNPDDLSYCKP